MTATIAGAALEFLATYLVHSTLLFGAAWVLGRYVARAEAWRDTLWKAALLGGVVTAVAAQASPWTPVRMALPSVLEMPSARPAQVFAPPAEHTTAPPAEHTTLHPTGSPESEGDAQVRAQTAPNVGDAPQHTAPMVGDAQAHTGAAALPGTDERSEAGTVTGRGPSLPWLLVAGWMTAVLLLTGRLGWRRARLARLLRNRRPVTEAGLPEMLAGLRRSAGVWVPVRLTTTPAIASPLVLGRREICVPERFMTELRADEQRAALAHELGHLARHDTAWLLGAMLLECVFFFQPLQGVARRGLRESAEYLADSWAVRLAGGRLSLARCLAEVAGWVSTSDEPALADMAAMSEGGSPLVNRVSRLLEREPELEPRRGLRAVATIALIVVAAAFAPSVGGALDPGGAGADPDAAGAGDPTTSSQPVADEGTEAAEGDSQDWIDVTWWPARGELPGGELPEGLRWADASAREAGAEIYWVAWAVESRVPYGRRAASDSEPGRWAQLEDDRAVAADLGVTHELSPAGAFEPAVVLVRLVAEGSEPRIDRLAMRTAGSGMDLRGHVYWLGRQDATGSLAWLRELYANAQNPRVRESAVEAIAVHAAADAPAFLRSVIEARAGRNLSEQAVEGLGWHPSDETTSYLFELASGAGDNLIRVESAETLGELDHPDAGRALRRLIRSADRRVREEALESLAERGDTALATLLLDLALNDPDESMRREAVELMQELPATVAVPLLRRVISESRDEAVVREAIETLGDIGTADALAAIETLVDHPAPVVRREAMEVLLDVSPGGLDGPALLQIALHDDDGAMRREAVEHMSQLPPQEAVVLLRRVVFESGDGTAERQAAETLGEVGTSEALAVLDEIIDRNPGEDASLQAVESMAENFARELVVPRLTRIAREHPSRRVRREAVEQLADLGGGA